MTHYFQYRGNVIELITFIRVFKSPIACLLHRSKPILYFMQDSDLQDHWREITPKIGDWFIIKDNVFYQDLGYMPQVKVAEFYNVLSETWSISM